MTTSWVASDPAGSSGQVAVREAGAAVEVADRTCRTVRHERYVAHHGRGARRRPVRLTRRGRVVLLAVLLVFCGLAVGLAAVPGEAADHRPRYSTAVVLPGDTLWSFASRNVPGNDPYAAIKEIRRLNGIDGYVIHSGQRLIVPIRR